MVIDEIAKRKAAGEAFDCECICPRCGNHTVCRDRCGVDDVNLCVCDGPPWNSAAGPCTPIDPEGDGAPW
jgi:hypothetical protein